VLVEQFLVHEKHHHDQEVAEEAEAEREGLPQGSRVSIPRAAPHHTPHHLLRFSRIHPGRIAFEVFGGLVLLKMSAGIARIFSRRRREHARSTVGSISRIRLFSATFAAYFFAKILKSHEVSSLRNGLAIFFATRAMKPLLRPDYRRTPPEAPPPTAPQAGFGLTPEMHPPEHETRMFH